MSSHAFSIKEAFKYGWDTTKKNFWFFAGLFAIILVTTFVINFISGFFQKELIPLGILIQLIGMVVSILFTMGVIYITLRFVDSVKSEYADIFSPVRRFVPFTVASFLFGLIVFAGTILFIVPGIFFAITLGFYRYLIIDTEAGIVESLKESFRITKGSRWRIFFFGTTMILLNLFGALAFFIGLFVTLPVSLMATAHVYRKLISAAGIAGTSAKENKKTVSQDAEGAEAAA